VLRFDKLHDSVTVCWIDLKVWQRFFIKRLQMPAAQAAVAPHCRSSGDQCMLDCWAVVGTVCTFFLGPINAGSPSMGQYIMTSGRLIEGPIYVTFIFI